MKNKKLIAIGVLIIGALAFAGCSSDSSDSKKEAKSPTPAVAPVAEPVQAPVANADQNKVNPVTKTDTKAVVTDNKKDVAANNSKEVMSNNTTTETNKVVPNKTEVQVNPTTKTEVKNTSSNQTSPNVAAAKNTSESKSSTSTTTTINQNTNNFGGINPNFVEHPEMNRTHTITYGQYATTTYNAATTTDADIINYYNAKIKGTNNAYFTLINGNNSIQFVNCDSQMLMKGPISIPSQHIIGNPTYYGEISGDKIIWRKASN